MEESMLSQTLCVPSQFKETKIFVIVTKRNVDRGMADKPCASYWDKQMTMNGRVETSSH